MGRPKKYFTDDERHAADRADKRRWYQKVKDNKRQLFRLRALKNYYQNKLKSLTAEQNELSVKEEQKELSVKDNIIKIQNKITEINTKIANL